MTDGERPGPVRDVTVPAGRADADAPVRGAAIPGAAIPGAAESGTSMSGAAIRARGFGWRYATRKAWTLRGLDLDIAAGERVLLLGRSGAGKSTLLAGL